jgi:hypothetical protein
MTKPECVKLEFTNTPPNNQKFFDISQKKYGKKIKCTAKVAGKKDTNYFSSKLKFTVDADCKNPKITCIHIVDVTHVGKTNDPLKVCGKYHYYYNIYCDGSSDCSSSSSSNQVIDDVFEQTIYNSLKSMLMTAKVVKYNGVIRVTFSLPVLFIDSMCMNIKVGTDKFAKGSDCNDCSLDAIGGKCDNDSSSSSSSSSSSTKCKKKNNFKNNIKYIAWAVIVVFILTIIRGQGSSPFVQTLKNFANGKKTIKNDN